MAIRIRCHQQVGRFHSDPHHSITSVGWVQEATGKRGTSTRVEVCNWLKYQNGEAYVLDGYGHRASVLPRENERGTQFLQTDADRVWTVCWPFPSAATRRDACR